MRILGIDPGLSGALAVVDSKTGLLVGLIDMPVEVRSVRRVRVKKGKKKGQMRDKVRRAVCGRRVADFVEETQPDVAIVEDVHSMPGQGHVNVWVFGEATGAVVAAVEAMNVVVHRVPPAVWKRAAGLIGTSKSASLTLARKRYKNAMPLLKLAKHDGRAEAVLIADYEKCRLASERVH